MPTLRIFISEKTYAKLETLVRKGYFSTEGEAIRFAIEFLVAVIHNCERRKLDCYEILLNIARVIELDKDRWRGGKARKIRQG